MQKTFQNFKSAVPLVLFFFLPGCAVKSGQVIFKDRFTQVRTIDFSGYTWRVKNKTQKFGPGPNYFSDSRKNVWVDNEGRLHLRIVRRNNQWHCAEVICTQSLGYGEYKFFMDSPIDRLDRNVIVGLFTWDDHPAYKNREIDIEFSRWGEEGNFNTQYHVHGGEAFDNHNNFDITFDGPQTLHSFDWRRTHITFESYEGHQKTDAARLERWIYDGPGVPPRGDENARINFWLLRGLAPAEGEEIEIIIKKFEFIPAR